MRSTHLRLSLRALALASALLILALPATVTSAPGAAADAVAANDGTLGATTRLQPATSIVRQTYDLLLDRFVAPLDSSGLLAAASEAAIKLAAQTKPGEWPGPRLEPDASRDVGWTAFAAWLDAVVGQVAPELDRPALEQAAVRGMVTSVQEGHTRYLTPAQYQDHLAWSRGDARYAGIGARLRGPVLTVVEVFEGSPAERAGLQRGDVILEIDGTSTEGASLEAAISRIRGPQGTPVELLIRRRGLEEPFGLTITRDEIRIAFVRWRMLDDGFGYIQLRGFPEPGVVDEVARALSELDRSGMSGLILDLRGNTGGRLDVGIRLTSRFVREGMLYEQVDRSGQRRAIGPNGSYWEHSVPVVVLVDAGTASMGEIFASALQDTGAAHLVGTKTSGNVAAAQVFPLLDGSAVQVTVLEILSARGARLNGVGVQPDEVVDASDEQLRLGSDPQLDAAITYLRDHPSVAGAVRTVSFGPVGLPLAA